MKFHQFINKQEEIYNPIYKKEKYITSSVKEHLSSFIKKQITSIGKQISFNENDLLIEYEDFKLKFDIKANHKNNNYIYLEFNINNKNIDIRINPSLFCKKNTGNYLKEVELYINKELSLIRKKF
jgi:hypothetical protein